MFNKSLLFLSQTNLRQIHEKTLSAQNTETDGFSIAGRNNGDTQRIFFIVTFHGNTSVLRNTAFCNIQSGHDFHARDD